MSVMDWSNHCNNTLLFVRGDTIGPPSTAESPFCSMLEQYYSFIVSQIKSILNLPVYALQALKTIFQRLYNLTYKVVESTLEILIAYVDKTLGLSNFDKSQGRNDFCAMAYECEAVIDFLFNEDSPALLGLGSGSGMSLLKRMGISDEKIALAKSSYTNFEEIVCKQTLMGLINQWSNEALAYVSLQLDELEEKMGVTSFLDDAITDYLSKLEEYKIFEYLDQFDKFAQCAFATCAFVETASNYKHSISDKLSIQRKNGSWMFKSQEWTEKVYSKNEEILGSIQGVRNKINQWTNQCVDSIQQGIPKEELTKE